MFLVHGDLSFNHQAKRRNIIRLDCGIVTGGFALSWRLHAAAVEYVYNHVGAAETEIRMTTAISVPQGHLEKNRYRPICDGTCKDTTAKSIRSNKPNSPNASRCCVSLNASMAALPPILQFSLHRLPQDTHCIVG